jgi:hypothetical protein
MNNIKLNYALIFAMVLQAIGLIWYVSKLDSKVETVYKFYEEESQKSVVVTQAKMQFDLELLLKEMEEVRKELATGRTKSKTIVKQHNRIFRMLKNKKGGKGVQQYGY